MSDLDENEDVLICTVCEKEGADKTCSKCKTYIHAECFATHMETSHKKKKKPVIGCQFCAKAKKTTAV
jgi:hypothetical protein